MKTSPLAIAGYLTMATGAAHLLALVSGLWGLAVFGLALIGLGYLVQSTERRSLCYLSFLLVGFGASAMLGHLVGASPLPAWAPAVALVAAAVTVLSLFLTLWRKPAPEVA